MDSDSFLCCLQDQSTPLHIAAQKSHLTVVKTLLAYNAKLDCVNAVSISYDITSTVVRTQ